MIRVASLAGCAVLALTAGAAVAETLVATRVIPARTVLGPGDVRTAAKSAEGAARDAANVVGREARVTIYAGRPIMPGDLTAPALIERNDLVRLRFASGALVIEADGRALDRGGVGDRITVMNIASRAVVTGRVAGRGLVEVAP